MKLTATELEQLGLIYKNKAELDLAFKLITNRKNEVFLSENERKLYRDTSEELIRCRYEINQALNDPDFTMTKEIISLDQMKKLFSILQPIVSAKADSLSEVASPYYIDSARNYGFRSKKVMKYIGQGLLN